MSFMTQLKDSVFCVVSQTSKLLGLYCIKTTAKFHGKKNRECSMCFSLFTE